jgi:cytochrome c peroxidase
MQLKKPFIIIGVAAAICSLQFCSKKADNPATPELQPTLPATPYNYSNIPFPAHILAVLPTQDNTPTGNPITDNGATLGRVLFYDKQLSKNNTVSCASCHKAEQSFSDADIKSKGFEGGLTARHSMPLLNIRFYRSGKMFWDERAATLEIQSLMPIQDLTEMGLTLTELQNKVSALSYYPALFQKAFGSTEITTDKIARALSQFIRSIVTYQSKYDRVKQGLETFTPDELAGEQAFLATPPTPPGAPPAISCAGCHTPPMFITSNPQAPFGLNDPADAGINNQNRFKSSSLRNIANTAPYFHNGSVPSLNDMLGLTPGATPIPAHSVAPPNRPRILAFMQTLTDMTVTTDPKFSNPFK